MINVWRFYPVQTQFSTPILNIDPECKDAGTWQTQDRGDLDGQRNRLEGMQTQGPQLTAGSNKTDEAAAELQQNG